MAGEVKIVIDCIGYQNINSKFKYPSNHQFEYDSGKTEGLCPECQAKLKELWLDELLDKRHKTMSFDSYNNNINKPIFNKVKKYAENINGNSIMLWGKRCGTGKTHLALATGRYYIENYPTTPFSYPKSNPVKFITESELLDKIRSTYHNSQTSESNIINELDCELLIYDDIGKVTPSNYDFLHRISFLLIDRLYRKCKPLIITSNLGLAELAAHLGEACVSRLYEMTNNNLIEVRGGDYRVKDKK